MGEYEVRGDRGTLHRHRGRFAGIDKQFDVRDLWRAELRRVEEILDARPITRHV